VSLSLSRSSSTSHLRLAAFRVRLAGGEAVSAGEGDSCGVDVSEDGAVGWGIPGSGGGARLVPAAAGARLRRRRRTSEGALASEVGADRRQKMVISLLPAW
jgi:hypothetical protein